ncbi:TlpA family protein disulfide reductase [Maribacter algicola]|uniref:TlpA family protein disulfide reductase n=1 Tax=Meishania litoralis TaxID=3434685 RepID=A0ACC7LQR3_9FLAO
MVLRIGLLLVLTVLVTACRDLAKSQAMAFEGHPEELPYKVQTSSFEDLNGNPVSLTDFKGKWVVLNYWATWCRPCIEEMPDLVRAQELLKNENYVFLLASDQSLEKIRAFVDERKFDLTFIRLKEAFAQRGVNALPTTFIYNTAGEQVLKIEGQTDWASDGVIDKFKAVQ